MTLKKLGQKLGHDPFILDPIFKGPWRLQVHSRGLDGIPITAIPAQLDLMRRVALWSG